MDINARENKTKWPLAAVVRWAIDFKNTCKEMPILSGFLFFMFLFITFIIVDAVGSRVSMRIGTVIDKHYTAERNIAGTGYGVGSDGKSGVIMTTQHEREKFTIIVKRSNGEVETVDSKPTLYYAKKIGDRIEYEVHEGFFTSGIWGLYGVR